MAKNIIILEEPLEKKLWKTADKLRKNMDAASMISTGMEKIPA